MTSKNPRTLWSLYRLYRTCNSRAVSFGLAWRNFTRNRTMVLNAFQIAKRAREAARLATPVTVAQARKRAVDAAKKPQRVVRVMDTAGRWITFEHKAWPFAIEGSLSARQGNDRRKAMSMSRI